MQTRGHDRSSVDQMKLAWNIWSESQEERRKNIHDPRKAKSFCSAAVQNIKIRRTLLMPEYGHQKWRDHWTDDRLVNCVRQEQQAEINDCINFQPFRHYCC